MRTYEQELDITIPGVPADSIEPIGFVWVECRDGTPVLWVSAHFINLEVGATYAVTARLLESCLRSGESKAKRIVAPLTFEDKRTTYAYEYPRTERWTYFAR